MAHLVCITSPVSLVSSLLQYHSIPSIFPLPLPTPSLLPPSPPFFLPSLLFPLLPFSPLCPLPLTPPSAVRHFRTAQGTALLRYLLTHPSLVAGSDEFFRRTGRSGSEAGPVPGPFRAKHDEGENFARPGCGSDDRLSDSHAAGQPATQSTLSTPPATLPSPATPSAHLGANPGGSRSPSLAAARAAEKLRCAEAQGGAGEGEVGNLRNAGGRDGAACNGGVNGSGISVCRGREGGGGEWMRRQRDLLGGAGSRSLGAPRGEESTADTCDAGSDALPRAIWRSLSASVLKARDAAAGITGGYTVGSGAAGNGDAGSTADGCERNAALPLETATPPPASTRAGEECAAGAAAPAEEAARNAEGGLFDRLKWHGEGDGARKLGPGEGARAQLEGGGGAGDCGKEGARKADGGEAQQGRPERLVYVAQAEVATADVDLVDVIGTDEMTTCVAVALRHPRTGRTALAHVDASLCTLRALAAMLASLRLAPHDPTPLQLHLVGAFDDDPGHTESILAAWEEQQERQQRQEQEKAQGQQQSQQQGYLERSSSGRQSGCKRRRALSPAASGGGDRAMRAGAEETARSGAGEGSAVGSAWPHSDPSSPVATASPCQGTEPMHTLHLDGNPDHHHTPLHHSPPHPPPSSLLPPLPTATPNGLYYSLSRADSAPFAPPLPAGTSLPVACALVSALHALPRPFRLCTLALLPLNTTWDPSRRAPVPRTRGLAVHVASGEASPRVFTPEERGPDAVLRSVLLFFGEGGEAEEEGKGEAEGEAGGWWGGGSGEEERLVAEGREGREGEGREGRCEGSVCTPEKGRPVDAAARTGGGAPASGGTGSTRAHSTPSSPLIPSSLSSSSPSPLLSSSSFSPLLSSSPSPSLPPLASSPTLLSTLPPAALAPLCTALCGPLCPQGRLTRFYDTQIDRFVLPPTRLMDAAALARQRLSMTDHELLHANSTSPLAEGPDFLPFIRSCYRLLAQSPDTDTLFPSEECAAGAAAPAEEAARNAEGGLFDRLKWHGEGDGARKLGPGEGARAQLEGGGGAGDCGKEGARKADGGEAQQGRPERLVYVAQAEVATADVDLVDVIGTDEMTTCVAVALRHPRTGRTALAHVDASLCTLRALAAMLASLRLAPHDPTPLQLHLVGAFDDDPGHTESILAAWEEQQERQQRQEQEKAQGQRSPQQQGLPGEERSWRQSGCKRRRALSPAASGGGDRAIARRSRRDSKIRSMRRKCRWQCLAAQRPVEPRGNSVAMPRHRTHAYFAPGWQPRPPPHASAPLSTAPSAVFSASSAPTATPQRSSTTAFPARTAPPFAPPLPAGTSLPVACALVSPRCTRSRAPSRLCTLALLPSTPRGTPPAAPLCPARRGLAVHVASGEASPRVFTPEERGPDAVLRSGGLLMLLHALVVALSRLAAVLGSTRAHSTPSSPLIPSSLSSSSPLPHSCPPPHSPLSFPLRPLPPCPRFASSPTLLSTLHPAALATALHRSVRSTLLMDAAALARQRLSMTDHELLHANSTSPLAEGPDFLPFIRSCYRLLAQSPDTDTLFPSGAPRVFTRDPTLQCWQRAPPPLPPRTPLMLYRAYRSRHLHSLSSLLCSLPCWPWL
ncbi:unnamed protein product [Closterium sp. Naga37s-1]|nr:unnamed protein product [Closterium sp. Naga37s-1]